MIQIFIKTPNISPKNLCLRLNHNTTVSDLKNIIHSKLGIRPALQNLYTNNQGFKVGLVFSCSSYSSSSHPHRGYDAFTFSLHLYVSSASLLYFRSPIFPNLTFSISKATKRRYLSSGFAYLAMAVVC